MLIVAILINVGAGILNGVGADLAVVVPVAAIAAVAAIIGLLRLTSGLGYSTGHQILLFLLVFVPLASLIMLVIVNARATKALRAGGYHVGLLGASPKKRTT